MNSRRIAALLTCHNRRETTLTCLEHLFVQDTRDGEPEVQVFLVDDGSSDGTSAAVSSRFPQVRLISGDGELYWCGGMRLAFEVATRTAEDFAFYLWLNDDTILYHDALRRLLATHSELATRGRKRPIVVGSVADPRTGKLTYGGLRRVWPLPFTRRVRPAEHPRRCTTLHGNCVLVPSDVARTVGNMDPALTHGRGDIDYGLRAVRLGFEIWTAPGFYGTCGPNPIGVWRDLGLPLRQRLASLKDPKYAIDEKILVARRHYGPLWFLSPLAVFLYIFLSHPLGLLSRRGSR